MLMVKNLIPLAPRSGVSVVRASAYVAEFPGSRSSWCESESGLGIVTGSSGSSMLPEPMKCTAKNKSLLQLSKQE